jgi:hypothetical protein
VDRPSIGVLTASFKLPLMGKEIGESQEGEYPKSPSFIESLKKNTCPSPPLTKGRKSNINRTEKEDKLGILEGSQ